MPPFNLSISKIGPESEIVLRNLLGHYLHDMSEWFEVDTQPDGSYSYDTGVFGGASTSIFTGVFVQYYHKIAL